MSCLYSSPEVTSLEIEALRLNALNYRCRGRSAKCGPPGAARVTCTSVMQFDCIPILPYVAIDKDAFPSNPALAAGCAKSFSLPKQAQLFASPGLSREVSSAISGFRSLCGRQRRSSLKPSRSIGPAFWNLSIGAGSRFENSGLHPQYPSGASTGPATLDRRCRRKVVAPAGYSKWFFCTLIRLYGGNFRPATARGIPARSALGGRSWLNPAAVIKASMSRL